MFRDVAFWENSESEDFEVYTDPLAGGWWYRIRRAQMEDRMVPASGYQLEAWMYGDPLPTYLLTEHPLLESASLAELIGCAAVLATEQTSPKYIIEGPEDELDRVRHRWTVWLKNPPNWVRELSLSALME
jgi:hypothetical protein